MLYHMGTPLPDEIHHTFNLLKSVKTFFIFCHLCCSFQGIRADCPPITGSSTNAEMPLDPKLVWPTNYIVPHCHWCAIVQVNKRQIIKQFGCIYVSYYPFAILLFHQAKTNYFCSNVKQLYSLRYPAKVNGAIKRLQPHAIYIHNNTHKSSRGLRSI